MENTKNFLFFSFAFSFGLLIYTFFIYVCYYLFFSTKEELEESSDSIEGVKKETIEDMSDLDFIEDV